MIISSPFVEKTKTHSKNRNLILSVQFIHFFITGAHFHHFAGFNEDCAFADVDNAIGKPLQIVDDPQQ